MVSPTAIKTIEATDFTVREGVMALTNPYVLQHGGVLADARMAYRLVGRAGQPVVLAIGGISGHRRVCAEDRGWWSPVVGAGCALDPQQFQVLGIDYLGGSGDSTAPTAQQSVPTLSAYDQARAIVQVLDALAIPMLHAVIGASYGGQVALALTQLAPSRVRRALVLSVAHRSHPMAQALRSVERAMVRFGQQHQDAVGGLKLARALAMCTYRTRREFSERFSGLATLVDDRLTLPVESYLFARGDAYVERYRPESFLALSESIDLFTIDPTTITVPVTVVAVPEDELVPFSDSETLVRLLPKGRLERLPSLFGHDAFLKEGQLLKPIFSDCLHG
jgi:homoserine O-acetyltransferase